MDLTLYQRALQILERIFGTNHPDVGIIMNNLGGLYRAIGLSDKVQQSYEEGLSILKNTLGSEHPHIAIVRANIESVLNKAPNKPVQQTRKTRR